MDEDGYFKVVGRIKDMILRGGENVYPTEVEDFLHSHPKIDDVQVNTLLRYNFISAQLFSLS